MRLPFLDLVRAIGASLIVLHHLAFYGPLADRAYVIAPSVFDWLVDNARMAVQVFLVMGGFFAARSISNSGAIDASRLLYKIKQRFFRISLPYWVTLAAAITANEFARLFMTNEAISARPTWAQLAAHVVLVQDLCGYEALTAGIWYLAIDFQLYVLTLLTFYTSQRLLRWFRGTDDTSAWYITLFALLPFSILSLFWFNRHSCLDCWAVYFLGSYYLGLLLHESTVNPSAIRWSIGYIVVAVAVGGVDSRPRVVVAALISLLTLLAHLTSYLQRWPRSRVVNYLGRSSYCLFLVHFPVLLVTNAWGVKYLPGSAVAAVGGLLLAYFASLVTSFILYQVVEKRFRLHFGKNWFAKMRVNRHVYSLDIDERVPQVPSVPVDRC
jgi:peptidoglycan/LPS O-acetylase OafA/YrhL